MTPEAVQKLAVRLAASGIAAGAVAARYTAALCGHDNVIGVDMGGTSTDISLVYDGKLRTTNEWFVEYGHPICFPSIEVLTIGAGGGSLAKIDAAGSLRNGPQSAGSRPRPRGVRQGRGGADEHRRQPRARPPRRAAGRRRHVNSTARPPSKRDPRRSPSRSASTLHEAADAIIAVANANMADAVRIISLQRGYDPREFALVVFGGAGPLHGAALAKELGVPTVLVPPRPGTWSALGCLMVDIRHDLSEMFLRPAADADAAELDEAFERLEAEGPRAAGVRGRHGGRRDARALDRDALSRPVALARGRATTATSTRPSSASTPSTSASSPTAATTRPSSSTGSSSWPPARPRRSSCPKHEPTRTRRLPEPIERRDGLLRRRGGRHARLRAQDLPGRRALRGPRRDRPARHDDARPTRRQGRGRRVPEHPDGGQLTWPHRTLDPVTFEVLKNSFVTVVDEMAEQILRTCHSFVIFSRDFSLRAARRQRRHDHAGLAGHRRPRRHAAPEGQGGARGLRGRHPRGRRVRRQRPLPRRHALPGRSA